MIVPLEAWYSHKELLSLQQQTKRKLIFNEVVDNMDRKLNDAAKN